MTDDSLPARLAPTMLSILRIVAALLFIEHGLSRLFGYPSPLPTPPLFTLYWFAGVIELAGGMLLTLGLFTRLAALIMSGEMAFAYFMVHYKMNHIWPILNHGNEAVLFCFLFLYLSAAGGGTVSLDRAIRHT